jgi:pimeloyl-ACP methyl ester carboxylesterase
LPTLILSGTYDPVTPPSYARLAAATLKNSFVIDFPGFGHDVLGNDLCAGVVTDIFLDNPATRPVDRCLDDQSPPDYQPPVD